MIRICHPSVLCTNISAALNCVPLAKDMDDDDILPLSKRFSRINAHNITTLSCNAESKCYLYLVMNIRYQPCLCLCLGFSQMILIAPFLLITLHFSQIGLTEDLTFIFFTPFKKVQHCNTIIRNYKCQTFFLLRIKKFICLSK